MEQTHQPAGHMVLGCGENRPAELQVIPPMRVGGRPVVLIACPPPSIRFLQLVLIILLVLEELILWPDVTLTEALKWNA